MIIIIKCCNWKSIYDEFYEIIPNESYEKILFNEVFFQNYEYYIYLL